MSEESKATSDGAAESASKPGLVGKLKATLSKMPAKVWGAIAGAAVAVWGAVAKAPAKVWGALSKAPAKLWAALPGMPANVWGAMSKAPAKVWGGLSGAAAKSWGMLSGAAAKVKATGQKATGAVTSWWHKRSKRAKTAIVAGGSLAVVMAGVAVFLVLFLKPVFVVEAINTEDAVVRGDDVVLSVDVVNEGRTGGEYKLRALVDGEEVQIEPVSLDAGAREQVLVSLSGLAAGHYDVALAGWPELAQNVWVMTPPDIQLDQVRVRPNPMDINTSDEAEVVVELSNDGEATGSYELEVKLDGEVVDTRAVEVKGEDDVDASFTVKVPGPGSCQVAVNGESVDLEIYRLGRPNNGTKLVQKGTGQLNRLEITNNDDMDCVVVLAKQGENQPFIAVYVRAHSAFTVKGISSATYECYYSFGEDWCTFRNEFTRYQWCGKFDDMLNFRVSTSMFYRSYTIYTIELGGEGSGGGDGAVSASSVNPDDFPDI